MKPITDIGKYPVSERRTECGYNRNDETEEKTMDKIPYSLKVTDGKIVLEYLIPENLLEDKTEREAISNALAETVQSIDL